MLGPPTSELVAGIQALVVAAVLLGLGYLVADLVVGDRDLDEVDRWGLALVGMCAFAFVGMLIHMATRGWFYSHPAIVRIVLLAALIGLGFLRSRRNQRTRGPLRLAAGLALLAVVVWGSPVFRMIPLTATADTQLHNGWISQMMAGETTPGGILTGDIPNYYPWLFHTLGAITATITPGQTPFHTLGPLHLLQVAGIVLALFALGRGLTARASTGVGAALLGAMSGGFGFVLLRGIDVVTDPRAGEGVDALRYHGDMLFSRSYNLSFHNLIPPFPRDFAFALLVSFVLLLALRARNRSAWIEVAAGATLGLVGLSGGETFIVATVLTLVVIAFDSDRRIATAARFVGAAFFVYGFWLVPIIVNYTRLEGFVSITHIRPIDLPGTAIAVSWGLATPLALAGAIVFARATRTERPIRLAAFFVAVSAVMLVASALIPSLIGDAFDTLGTKHRYWPILYLSVAVVGALGFTWLFDTLRRRSELVTALVGIVVFAMALASPVSASLATPSVIKKHEDVRSGMVESEDSLLHVVRDIGPGCTIATPQNMSRAVFGFTGFRMLAWTGNWLGENRARIRWAGIYEHITPEEQRIEDNRLLVTRPDDPLWRDIADEHDIDVVVTSEPPSGFEATPVMHSDEEYWVVQLNECSAS